MNKVLICYCITCNALMPHKIIFEKRKYRKVICKCGHSHFEKKGGEKN